MRTIPRDFSLAVKVGVSALVIYLCSLLASTLSVFGSLEYWLLEYWQGSNARTILSERGKPNPQPRVDSLITVVDLWVGEKTNQEYLDNCLAIADEISRYEPSVMMIPLPRGLLITPEATTTLRRLADHPFVVFGFQVDRMPHGQKFTRHPAFGQIPMRWGVITMQSPGSWLSHNWIYPASYTDPVDGKVIPDVSLRIAQQFLGESEEDPVLSLYDVHLGSIAIPLFSHGAAYFRQQKDPFRSWFLIIDSKAGTDSLTYIDWGSQNRYENALPDTLQPFFQGRMVLLVRSTPSDYDERFVHYSYVNVIYGILGQGFVRDGSEFTMLLLLVAIAVAALSVYLLRFSLAISVMIASGLAGVLISYWILDTTHTYLDSVYVPFTLVLCLIVMPLLRLSHENRKLRELITSRGIESSE